MNIKEVEEKTGITRANVRFYEKKELLIPERSENGYRDYSEKDVEALRRIKLMRLIYVPIDEIKALEDGKAEFKDVMEKNAIRLEKEAEQYERSKEITNKLAEEEREYAGMNPEKYLMELEHSEEQEGLSARLRKDTLDADGTVWCRYFARVIDASLLTGIINVAAPDMIHAWVSSLNVTMSIVWAFIFAVIYSITAIIIEPLFIMVFKATPGKFIFGIKIEHESGRNLTYGEGVKRTAGATWYGMGLNLPVIAFIREIISYSAYSDGKVMQWDRLAMSYVNTEDMNRWRVLLGILAVIVLEIFTF